ncbi:NAD(P)/FAD-dependent oxidoreductase [Corynebacterium tuberculostearicum]|uniref:NAD(P)/FAD-dependent oxidoreductase n=1 Tax=Corynebacterium tuberculostearicum TaxID=38304 RepID=UPI00264B04AF|nr:NAD(P)/FAD-dependent oxidoreductase [Corynebacterium tuberculostearicum]MDN8595930.1 NAD(P)/FAD-dependent oxidoreductase [Corynebacterium tuberculostearicum]
MYSDVIIIGGGFAGTAAAITLARANRNIQLIDSGAPRNRFSEHAHGILGLDGAAPAELLQRGHAEVKKFGGTITHGSVEKLSRDSEHGPWQVELSSGEVLESRHVLVATGLTDKLPAVPGLSDLWGTRVFHCPYCHGYEVTGKKVALIGGANPPFTIRISKLLSTWTDTLTFYPNGLELTDLDRTQLAGLGVKVVDAEVTQVQADEATPTGVVVQSSTGEDTYEACFTGPDFLPNDALLRDAGCESANGWVSVERGQTSIPRLWAAGNVVSSPDQVSQAMGSGAAVGIAIDQRMLDEDLVEL